MDLFAVGCGGVLYHICHNHGLLPGTLCTAGGAYASAGAKERTEGISGEDWRDLAAFEFYLEIHNSKSDAV